MSRLPRKVREQAAAAEAALKEITEAPEVDEAPVEETPAEETEVAEAPEESAEVVPETQPEEVASEEVSPDEAKWEERYKALQGKYNAEVPRLHAEIKDLKEEIRNALQAATTPREVEQPIAPPPAPPSEYIEKIRDDYGDELANAFAASKAENDALRQQVNDLLNRTDQMQSTSALAQFATMLEQRGIDFDQQNNDPLFLEWLNEIDTFSGVSKQQMLSQAFESGDLSRAAEFFTAYAGQQVTSQKIEPKPKPSMEEHVTVKSNAAPKENVMDTPVAWTQQQIREFYRNKTAGMYSPEEAERLENQLFVALRN